MDNPFARLSRCERRTLIALTCGPTSNKALAAQLMVSTNTVKSQLSAIFRKLGVHTRSAAAVCAWRGKVGEFEVVWVAGEPDNESNHICDGG